MVARRVVTDSFAGAREMDQKSRREAWLLASGMILVPFVAALAVLSQMLLQ